MYWGWATNAPFVKRRGRTWVMYERSVTKMGKYGHYVKSSCMYAPLHFPCSGLVPHATSTRGRRISIPQIDLACPSQNHDILQHSFELHLSMALRQTLTSVDKSDTLLPAIMKSKGSPRRETHGWAAFHARGIPHAAGPQISSVANADRFQGRSRGCPCNRQSALHRHGVWLPR